MMCTGTLLKSSRSDKVWLFPTASAASADEEAKDQRLKDQLAEAQKKYSLFSRLWLLVDVSARSNNGLEDMTFST